MTISELARFLESLFPLSHRFESDFDGLQCCPDPKREVKTILLALDATPTCVIQAQKVSADLVLTHHPLFWGGIQSIARNSSMDENTALSLIQAGISCYTLHTRFDAAPGGMNDTLASRLSLHNVLPAGLPDDPILLGRIASLAEPMPPIEFARFVSDTLRTQVLFTAGKSPISRVFLVSGSGKDYLSAALSSGADCLLTGEANHHARLAAEHHGLTLLEAGHYGTEILFCDAIAPFLKQSFPELSLIPFTQTPHELCILPKV